MSNRYSPCPLGDKCPGSGRHLPNSKTMREHKKWSVTGIPERNEVDNPVSDLSPTIDTSDSGAGIRADGTLTFGNIKDKADRVEALQRELSEGMTNVAISQEAFDEYIDFARKCYSYSFRNQILLTMQKPDGSHFRTYKQWNAMGYEVMKGSQAAYILRPNGGFKVEIKDKNGNPVIDDKGDVKKMHIATSYTSFPVFSDKDIDQSEKKVPGHPLAEHFDAHRHNPDISDNDAMRSDLSSVAERMGVPVHYQSPEENLKFRNSPGTGGYARRISDDKYEIVINTDAQPHSQTRTLAHEVSHILCGHLDNKEKRNYSGNIEDRAQMEVEAESMAYAIGRDYGLDMGDSSFTYLKSWAEDDEKKIGKAMGNVARGLDSYYGHLEKYLTGTNQREEREKSNQKNFDNKNKESGGKKPRRGGTRKDRKSR